MYKKRGILIIDKVTGEKKRFDSVNSAAQFIGTNFCNVQRAAMNGGTCKHWTVYEDANTIKNHIKRLQELLKVVEDYDKELS